MKKKKQKDCFVELNPIADGDIIPNIRYKPEDFKEGDKVRLYLSYPTDKWIFVREGRVIDTKKQKRGSDVFKEVALEIRVEAAGRLVRTKPWDVVVRNVNRAYHISGHVETQPKEYTMSYFYHCITRVDILQESSSN